MHKNWRALVKPQSLQIDDELTNRYGKFVCAPLERGFGYTLGNALRRVLLSSLQGTAVVGVYVEGVTHEYTSLDGMKEDITELILNIKDLKLKMNDVEQARLTLEVSGPGEALAGDIQSEDPIEVLNPTHHLASLSDKGVLKVEMIAMSGKGYVTGDRHDRSLFPSEDWIAVDAIFSPIERVNYEVSNARVEQITDYDKLEMEVVTDGSVNPDDALAFAAKILKEQLQVFITFNEEVEPIGDEEARKTRSPIEEVLNKPVTELEFSVRSFNCLKAAGIKTVGELIARTESEMLQTKNFGKKSLQEIKSILGDMGLTLGMDVDELRASGALPQ